MRYIIHETNTPYGTKYRIVAKYIGAIHTSGAENFFKLGDVSIEKYTTATDPKREPVVVPGSDIELAFDMLSAILVEEVKQHRA